MDQGSLDILPQLAVYFGDKDGELIGHTLALDS
jgi:hypothetical protein